MKIIPEGFHLPERLDELRSNASSAEAEQLKNGLLLVQSDFTADLAKANREPTASESRELAYIDAVTYELEALRSRAEREERYDRVDRTGVVAPSDGFGWAGTAYERGKSLTDGQSMSGYVAARNLVREDEQDLDFAKYLKGMATGDWDGAAREFKAMVEGTSSAGGYLVPTPLSGQLIDLVRNSTRVMQAGATVVPMESRTLDVAKWAGDPAGAWHTELAAVAPTDATLSKVTLTAQAWAANVQVSWELLEDAPGVADKLREAFAAQLALKLDLAALYGTGTAPEPRGVKNVAAVTKTPLGANGAALTSWDAIIDAVGRVRDANEEPTAVIYSGRTARSLAKLKDSTGQPLQVPDYISGLPRHETQQVPNTLTVGSSGVTSDAFVADWRQLLVGIRTQLRINVLAERYADVGAAGFIAWFRGDIQVARPAAFDVVTGIL